jgi:zinc/manganese transport system substrate-binding protein
MRKIIIFLLSMSLCAWSQDKVKVSSFSTILTEIAEQVGGERVAVTGHVKPDTDPHDFEPRPSDLKIVTNADLVLVSAKHMEGYLNKLKEATGTKGSIVEVGDRFPSLQLNVDHGDHSHEGEDPHWWHSIRNISRATKIVRDELIRVSPADKALFQSNTTNYLNKMEQLDKWVKTKLAELPRDRRKLVTNHDAFGYFAKDYGFTVLPIAGVSKNDQPSSKKVAEIIQTIKSQGVKAVFSEDIENPKVITEITRETGATIAGSLLSDGLSEKRGGTIEGMFKHNVTTIVNGLK